MMIAAPIQWSSLFKHWNQNIFFIFTSAMSFIRGKPDPLLFRRGWEAHHLINKFQAWFKNISFVSIIYHTLPVLSNIRLLDRSEGVYRFSLLLLESSNLIEVSIILLHFLTVLTLKQFSFVFKLFLFLNKLAVY